MDNLQAKMVINQGSINAYYFLGQVYAWSLSHTQKSKVRKDYMKVMASEPDGSENRFLVPVTSHGVLGKLIHLLLHFLIQ